MRICRRQNNCNREACASRCEVAVDAVRHLPIGVSSQASRSSAISSMWESSTKESDCDPALAFSALNSASEMINSAIFKDKLDNFLC